MSSIGGRLIYDLLGLGKGHTLKEEAFKIQLLFILRSRIFLEVFENSMTEEYILDGEC